jgi:hypothetical protein
LPPFITASIFFVSFILTIGFDERITISAGQSLREDGKKVQVLIDDHIRSLNISELMNPKEITYTKLIYDKLRN